MNKQTDTPVEPALLRCLSWLICFAFCQLIVYLVNWSEYSVLHIRRSFLPDELAAGQVAEFSAKSHR